MNELMHFSPLSFQCYWHGLLQLLQQLQHHMPADEGRETVWRIHKNIRGYVEWYKYVAINHTKK